MLHDNNRTIFTGWRCYQTLFKYIVLIFTLLPNQLNAASFSFVVTADMRNFAGSGKYDNKEYFKGVCEAIAKTGSGAFMIIPGDLDPPEKVQWTIEQYIGKSYVWYPAAGNHEAETPEDMAWLREYNKNGNSLPHIVNIGPAGCKETTYSFDYENAHFAVINQYYDGQSDIGTDGDMVDELYDWLAADLAATTKRQIFVIGHEPAYAQADEDNGRERHIGDSMDQYPPRRDRFWNLLRKSGVVAYICGHTHNFSAVNMYGVWQIDVGHARGKGDTGSPSTFVIIQVEGDKFEDIKFTAYRDNHDGVYDYDEIIHGWNASLPIEQATFTARMEQSDVVLEWQTEGELMNLGFILERFEKDMDNWNEIASYLTQKELVGHGTVAYPARYKYIDKTVQPGFTYEYRLADVSYDEKLKYHGTVEITVAANNESNFPVAAVLKPAYPNPFKNGTMINYIVNEKVEVKLSVIDLLGRTVKQFFDGQVHDAGYYSVKWDATNNLGYDLPRGIYLVILNTGKTINFKKLIVLR